LTWQKYLAAISKLFQCRYRLMNYISVTNRLQFD